MSRQSVVRSPFLIVNPKAYLASADTLALARLTDELAEQFGIDVIFTAQHVDVRTWWPRTPVASSSRLVPRIPSSSGRGMGHILPDSLRDAGAGAVVLNHAEHPLTLAVLDETMQRAREVGLATIVCADSDAQCKAIAGMGPDIMICEPTANIGTGQMDAGGYIERTTRIVKDVDPTILVIQAAGVSTGADVARVLVQGADGSGGTSGIVRHLDWRAILTEMSVAIAGPQKQSLKGHRMLIGLGEALAYAEKNDVALAAVNTLL
ncbi:MAG: triose-phosphate isomerase [Tessaracoccus sp.]